jgi:glucokinase
MNTGYYLGIDIGGTKCAVIAGSDTMEIFEKRVFQTETWKGPDHALNLLIETASDITGKRGPEGLKAIGISCGGPLDSKNGIVQSPPNLPGWDNIPVVKIFRDIFKVPVYLQNDANASALAEWKFGAGKGTDNMIFLTFGTGMGAGIIIDGRLYSGTSDMAGEAGHIRLAEDGPEGYGKKGSFEGFCSGGGIARLAQKIASEKFSAGETVSFCKSADKIDGITARDVAEAAADGDKTALEIFETSGRYLGYGLSVLIDILNPRMIVIGSIYVRCREFLEPACMRIIEKEALENSRKVCRIVPSVLEDKIGDFASLSVAILLNNMIK